MVGFRLLCATPDNKAERRFYGGWLKAPVPFKPFVDQSSPNFRDMYEPLVLASILARMSMACLIQKIFAIKSSKNRTKFFGPDLFGRDDLDFSTTGC